MRRKRVAAFDFGAQAMDELVDGVVGNTGAVFDIRVDRFANLIFRNNLMGMGL